MGEYAELAIEQELAEEFGLYDLEIDKPMWTTISGNKIYVKDMETAHIKSCIKMLDKKGKVYTALNEELKKRIKDGSI